MSTPMSASWQIAMPPVWKSKFYGAFVLNHRVVLHAIDATPARWRGDTVLERARTAASSPICLLWRFDACRPGEVRTAVAARTPMTNEATAAAATTRLMPVDWGF